MFTASTNRAARVPSPSGGDKESQSIQGWIQLRPISIETVEEQNCLSESAYGILPKDVLKSVKGLGPIR